MITLLHYIIHHFRHKNRTGTEMRSTIVSGIVTGDALVSCFLVMRINRKLTFCISEPWFGRNFRQIVFIRVKSLNNANLVTSRHNRKKRASLPVNVHCSKMLLL